MIKEGNVIRYLSTQNREKKFRGQIFILYISKNNCLYKQIEDNTVNNIKTLSNIKNLKCKKDINEKSLIFYQMNNVNKPNVKVSDIHGIIRDMRNIITNYKILQKNIDIILDNCEKPINKDNINLFLKSGTNLLQNIDPIEEFTFDSILEYLKYMKKFIEDNNFEITYKNFYNSINNYLNFWEQINK